MTLALLNIICLTILLFLWHGPLWQPRKLPGVDRQRPLLIGHRGVRGARPENTLEAFQYALDAGLDGVECDVQRTRDGQLVLVHDLHIAGRAVTSLSHEELLRYDARVPLLEELLQLMTYYPGTLLNVELKVAGLGGYRLIRSSSQAIYRSGEVDRVIVSSFNRFTLLQLRLVAPRLRCGLLIDESTPRFWQGGWLAGWYHVDAVHPHFRKLTPRLMHRYQKRGLTVSTWTVNEDSEVQKALALEVDGIMADDPVALRQAAAAER
ncbi:MAG: glycerophosphodiester phosphodiesterase [Trueperaceae bacterium]|nr:MAG: glycerophosphodiester phosphodiesterase [Trueperaceae bacterium]